MAERSLTERVEILERKVDALESLPARVTAVEVQLVQLRDEMHAEFSATRELLRAEMREGNESLRREIRAGDEETQRHMRVLHEDVIARFAMLQEGQRLRGKR